MKYRTNHYTYRQWLHIARRYKREPFLLLRKFYRLLMKKQLTPPHYLVVPEKGIAYLNNPKCACSSIKYTLYGLDSQKNRDSANVHQTAATLRNKRFQLSQTEQEYFKFTFVRNPFKRLVSFYVNKFYQAVQVNRKPFSLSQYLDGVFSGEMTFAQMVEILHTIPLYLANNHFKPQSYIVDSQIVNKMEGINFIGRLENIDHQWKDLAKRFDLPEDLKHMNASPNYNYMDYYDLHTLELVNEYYKEDIERFGYTDVYDKIKGYLATKEEKS